MMLHRSLLVLVTLILTSAPVRAMEHVVFKQDGKEVSVSGELVVTAEDGVRHGGAGAFLIDAMAAEVESAGLRAPATRVLGVPRQFLAQGKADDILTSLGLDGTGIAESVRRVRLEVPAEPPL